MDWLDKLEKRLRKSPKSAADAEEISDELDVSITFYMTVHPFMRVLIPLLTLLDIQICLSQ
jgi:hypothetical protein